jgi:ribosome-binding ATPase YchF (GTP1/OBG family)
MAKLTSNQINVLVSKAMEQINVSLNKTFQESAKKEKLVSDYLKITKEINVLQEKTRALNLKEDQLRDSIRKKFETKGLSVSFYGGKVELNHWKVRNELQDELVLQTIGKDVDADELIKRLVSKFI